MGLIRAERNKLEIYSAQLIKIKIRKYSSEQKNITLAIPGGSSVKGIFTHLKTEDIPWENVHVYMVDERLVPITHKDSNFRLAKESFLDELTSKGKIPEKNIHPFNHYDKPPLNAIDLYNVELSYTSKRFDIALLSAGPDGHVASLFPNHHTIMSKANYFTFTDSSPKPPIKRISASKNLLERSQTAILLFLGESKRKAYKNFNNPELSVSQCPAKLINNIKDSYVFTDIN